MALLVEKETVQFLLLPETLMVLLEPVLMCMVHCLKVQTVFLELLPVVSCAGDFALDTVVSVAAASPGSRLLRVLGGGHSADRGGCSWCRHGCLPLRS